MQGTEINAEVRHGRNALHYAADAGKVPIVRFLLENMAIIDVRDWFFFLFFFPFFVYFCVCKRNHIRNGTIMPDYNLLITDDFVVRAALLLAGFVGSFEAVKKTIKGCLRVIARAMVN